MEADLILKDGISLLPHPDNPDRVVEESVDIAVKNGLIYKIGSCQGIKAEKILSQKHLHILPGLIDTQVHFREPGMEHKENIAQGSLAALKGGMSAFFEMPNTIPPTTTNEAFADKIRRADGRSWCDFAFYMGAAKNNIPFLKDLKPKTGLCGIKVFMGRSTGGLLLDDEKLLEEVISGARVRVAVHSEDEERLKSRRHLANTPPPHPKNHPFWRDEKTALISTKKAVAVAEKLKKPIHILHISTEEEMVFLKSHRKFVSTEVTPQHLSLSAPECYEKWGSLVQMNPPIREKRHQQALWKALREGLVDMIGSDHAPHTWEEKQKPYPLSPSGFPGTQTLLPLMLNHINKGRLDLKLLVKLLAHNPSKQFQLKNQGVIKEGLKAHFTVVDLKATRKIETHWLESKCGWSPFVGQTVTGWPIAVFLYGKPLMTEGEVKGAPPGQPIEFLSHSHGADSV